MAYTKLVTPVVMVMKIVILKFFHGFRNKLSLIKSQVGDT